MGDESSGRNRLATELGHDYRLCSPRRTRRTERDARHLNLASELEAQGEDVVDLSVGAPDFDPGQHHDAAKDALDAGHTGYTSSNGIPELKEAIARQSPRDGSTQYGPDNLIVTPGGKQALFETSRPRRRRRRGRAARPGLGVLRGDGETRRRDADPRRHCRPRLPA